MACSTLKITYFIYLVSLYSSSYLFSLTAINRYLRVKYLETYTSKFKLSHFHFTMVLYMAAVFIQSAIGTYFNLQHYIGYAGKYTGPFNLFQFLCVVFFYSMSRFKLRQYQQLSDEIKQVIKITTVYLYLFVVSQGLVLAYQIILHLKNIYLSESNRTILQNLLGLLPSFVGWINALSFIGINPRARDITIRLTGLNRLNRVGPI